MAKKAAKKMPPWMMKGEMGAADMKADKAPKKKAKAKKKKGK